LKFCHSSYRLHDLPFCPFYPHFLPSCLPFSYINEKCQTQYWRNCLSFIGCEVKNDHTLFCLFFLLNISTDDTPKHITFIALSHEK
jgi:hypothetical protein